MDRQFSPEELEQIDYLLSNRVTVSGVEIVMAANITLRVKQVRAQANGSIAAVAETPPTTPPTPPTGGN